MKKIEQIREWGFDQQCINWVINKQFCFTESEIATYLRTKRVRCSITIENFKRGAKIIEDNGDLFKKIESD